MYNSSLKILRLLPPELSHTITINFLKYFKVRQKNIEDSILSQHLMGLDFINNIGLSAGFDKNAEVMHSMFSFGFGFLEVGTITPDPQFGNPKPRLFRLLEEHALVNKMGFNNKGMLYVSKIARKPKIGIVGVNLGANAKSIDKILDYKNVFEFLAHLFDYVTINVSSPNTKNLRDLQKPETLEKILKNVNKINFSSNELTA